MPHSCSCAFTPAAPGILSQLSERVAPKALAPQWRARNHAKCMGSRTVAAPHCGDIHQALLHHLLPLQVADVPRYIPFCIRIQPHSCVVGLPPTSPPGKHIPAQQHQWVGVVNELQAHYPEGNAWCQLQLHHLVYYTSVAVCLPCARHRVSSKIAIYGVADLQPQDPCHPHIEDGLVAARIDDS